MLNVYPGAECIPSTFDLNLGLLNIRSLTSSIYCFEIITDEKFNVLNRNKLVCSVKLAGRGADITMIYNGNLGVTLKIRHIFNVFKVLYFNLKYVVTKNNFTQLIPLIII